MSRKSTVVPLPLGSSLDLQYLFFSSLPDCIIIENFEGDVVYQNSAALRILSFQAVGLNGNPSQPWSKFIDENGQNISVENTPARLAFLTGSPQENRLLGEKVDSQTKWYSVTAIPLRDPNSNRVLVISSLRDVTKEMKIKIGFEKVSEELQLRERFLSATLDQLPCLVCYVSPELNYLYLNAAFERWHGQSVESAVGRPLKELSGPAVFAAIEEKLHRALRGESVRSFDHIPDHPGGVIYTQLHFYPDFGDAGVVRGIYCVVEDVTQAKLAELALKQSERRSLMLDNLPGAISYWNLECKIVHTNLAYAQSWGRTVEQMTGIHMRDLIGEEFFNADQHYRNLVFAGHASNVERKVPDENGGYITYLISFLPDMRGTDVVGFFVMSNNISVLHNAEAEKREMEARLVAASKMSSLGEMAGGVAHEINNPLAIISGRTSIIQNLLMDDEPNLDRVKTELEKINVTVERIAKIIRGLKAFARNADGDDFSSCSLKVILNDTVELCRERMKALAVEFRFDFENDLQIDCRPAQISQIVMNLIGNSIDAIAEQSVKWISLSVTSNDSEIVISVKDSGARIPADVVEKMMNPFYTTKEIGKGTGLGLSISKGLAEKNNAKLKYVRGESTQFVLEISRLAQVVKSAA